MPPVSSEPHIIASLIPFSVWNISSKQFFENQYKKETNEKQTNSMKTWWKKIEF